jgi:hypothetical protein
LRILIFSQPLREEGPYNKTPRAEFFFFIPLDEIKTIAYENLERSSTEWLGTEQCCIVTTLN